MNEFWTWIRNEDTGQRELWMEGVIASEGWWGDELTPAIFKNELFADHGPVLIHLCSPGGDCIAASQIYTMLMDYPYDVTVQIDGLAASAASVIAMAGTKVCMSPTSVMMIHNPFTAAVGDSDEMRRAIQLLDEVKESIINAYEIKTGLSRTRLSHLMDNETWMSAHKAKELGFCDEVLYTNDAQEYSASDFAFERRSAAVCLMNRVIASIPKTKAAAIKGSEHLPGPEPESTEPKSTEPKSTEPETKTQGTKTPEPATVTPDNHVRASDLEKRLALLK